MSEKFVYENARIKSLEVKLLTRQSMQRLLDSGSAQAAFKTLSDMGFGMGANVPAGDFDALFAAEEAKCVATVKEFNVAGALDAFLLQYDFLTLKLLLKAYASGKNAEDNGLEGLYSFESLRELCYEPSEEKLAGHIGGAVKDVRALVTSGKATPRAIDIAVDRRMYACVRETAKERIVKEYFRLKTDGANLLSFLRARRLGLDEKFFEEGYIEGGAIELRGLYGAQTDAILDGVKGSEFFEAFKKALESGDAIGFEVAADNILLAFVRAKRDDMFSVAPILSYCLQKQTELKAAKLIVAGIRNGVDGAVIRERLRDVNA